MSIERVEPVSGTELARQYDEAHGHVITEREIHTTRDQLRLFRHHVLVGGGKWLGTVADETARLALNTSQVLGCWPGDFCEQTTPHAFGVCRTNRGAATGDWMMVSPQEGRPGHWEPLAESSELLFEGGDVVMDFKED